MATNWRKNDKVHEVNLRFNKTATESIQNAAVAPDGKDAGFESPPIAPGDPDNQQGQDWAAQLEDGTHLDGLNVMYPPAKFTKDRGAHLKTRASQNAYGDAQDSESYGFGKADHGRWNRDKGKVREKW